MKKVVVAGSLNYDIFLTLSSVPKVGETANASSSKSAAGGKGANQAVQIAKLGTPVVMVGSVGRDQMGRALFQSLQSANVDCRYVKEEEGLGTGMGIVDVFPDGSVMAVISHGANYAVTREDIQKAEEEIATADILVLQLEIPMETVRFAIRLAAGCGTKVLLNAAPAAKLEDAYIQKCDYFVVNEVEASFYAKATIDSVESAKEQIPGLAKKYGNCWICTLGKEGALIACKDQVHIIPAVQTEVVETTGAGDSFVGGFCHGILQGMDVCSAGEFAACCSAITIRNVGAQNSMQDEEAFFREYKVQTTVNNKN